MAGQQNFDPPQQDHLDVARRMLEAGPSTAEMHVLIDIAESLRHLRPVSQLVAEAPRMTIAEEDWEGVLDALEQVSDLGMYAPATVIAQLRGALGR